MNIFIDWLFNVLRRIGNISAILLKSDQFWNLEVSLATLASRSERQLHSSNKARGTTSYDCKQYMWRIIYQVHVVGVNALWFFLSLALHSSNANLPPKAVIEHKLKPVESNHAGYIPFNMQICLCLIYIIVGLSW